MHLSQQQIRVPPQFLHFRLRLQLLVFCLLLVCGPIVKCEPSLSLVIFPVRNMWYFGFSTSAYRNDDTIKMTIGSVIDEPFTTAVLVHFTDSSIKFGAFL